MTEPDPSGMFQAAAQLSVRWRAECHVQVVRDGQRSADGDRPEGRGAAR